MADLSRELEGAEFADLVFEGDGRVDAVQVAEVESFDAEAAEARFDGCAQVLEVAERAPDIRGRAGQADLGGQQKLGRIWVQGVPSSWSCSDVTEADPNRAAWSRFDGTVVCHDDVMGSATGCQWPCREACQ